MNRSHAIHLQPTPYQIDFTAISSGKHVSISKKRIRWVFGFANMSAIASGLEGVECRGEEHEVVLAASLASGKRLVVMDGKEVHRRTEQNKSVWKFEYAFDFGGDNHLEIEANMGVCIEWFELKLNGQSFSKMKKIYELGVGAGNSAPPQRLTYPEYPRVTQGVDTRSVPRLTQGVDTRLAPSYEADMPHSADEEQRMLEAAIRLSQMEIKPAIEAAPSHPRIAAHPSPASCVPLLAIQAQNHSQSHPQPPTQRPLAHAAVVPSITAPPHHNPTTAIQKSVPRDLMQFDSSPTLEETWQDLIDFSKEEFVIPQPPQPQQKAPDPFADFPMQDFTATMTQQQQQQPMDVSSPYNTNPNNYNPGNASNFQSYSTQNPNPMPNDQPHMRSNSWYDAPPPTNRMTSGRYW